MAVMQNVARLAIGLGVAVGVSTVGFAQHSPAAIIGGPLSGRKPFVPFVNAPFSADAVTRTGSQWQRLGPSSTLSRWWWHPRGPSWWGLIRGIPSSPGLAQTGRSADPWRGCRAARIAWHTAHSGNRDDGAADHVDRGVLRRQRSRGTCGRAMGICGTWVPHLCPIHRFAQRRDRVSADEHPACGSLAGALRGAIGLHRAGLVGVGRRCMANPDAAWAL